MNGAQKTQRLSELREKIIALDEKIGQGLLVTDDIDIRLMLESKFGNNVVDPYPGRLTREHRISQTKIAPHTFEGQSENIISRDGDLVWHIRRNRHRVEQDSMGSRTVESRELPDEHRPVEDQKLDEVITSFMAQLKLMQKLEGMSREEIYRELC